MSAWASSNRLVLGGLSVNEKFNGITAIPLLLKIEFVLSRRRFQKAACEFLELEAFSQNRCKSRKKLCVFATKAYKCCKAFLNSEQTG
jgi:hypothetical protein